MGDRRDKDSVYHRDHISENLPFLINYKANVPLLQKVQLDKELACEVLQYVDNLRIIYFPLEMTWCASSQIVKGLCWYGLQDLTQKRRRASQCLGPWTGSDVITDRDVVTKSVIKE